MPQLVRTYALFTFITLFLTLPAAAATLQVDAATGTDSGDCTSSPCATISYALTQASAGDLIQVANGTYNLGTSTFNVSKEITIVGESEAGVVIDASGIDGYGIFVDASNVTIEDLTLIGPQAGSSSNNYGFKIQPPTNVSTDFVENITLRNITVQGSGRSEVDLNGVDNSLLENITADGQNTAGMGIALTDVNGITLTSITTTDNDWGSIAFYTGGGFYEGGIDDVELNGTNSFGEDAGVFKQEKGGFTVTNLTLPASFTHSVRNEKHREPTYTDSDQFTYFRQGQTDAVDFALALNFPEESYINALSDGSFLVGANGSSEMSIQAAIDAADPGDVVDVSAATFTLTSQINVNKANLTLQGAGTGSTMVEGADGLGGGNHFFNITADGVTFSDFSVTKTDKAGVQNMIYVGGNNVTISGNEITGQFALGDPDVSRAMEIETGITGMLIENNTIGNLRQPAYVNASSGQINNNNVYSTKGWVVDGPDNSLSFSGNTWGSGAQANVFDIAILAGTDASFYPDITVLSDDNNDAVVEDQRVSPAVLSVVYVDAAASAGGNGSPTEPFQTIQAADARVVDGGTVLVAAGAYSGSVTFTKRVALEGSGDGSDPLTNTVLSGSGSGVGLTLAAGADATNRTLVRDFRVENFNNGIVASSFTTLENVTSTNSNRGTNLGSLQDLIVTNSAFTNNASVGFRVGTGAVVDGVQITGSTIDNNDIGMYIAEENPNSGAFTNVTVTSTTFNGNARKGIYAEKMSNALFDDVTVDGSGTDPSYGFNNGIDINLKWASYSNITIQNSSIINSGAYGSPPSDLFPAAVAIKARDDAPSYDSPAGSLSGVTLDNVTISGPENGLRFGEAGKLNASPTGVTISNSQITGNNTAGTTGQAIIASSSADVDATTGNTVNGTAIAGATDAELFTVEDAIFHALDDPDKGFVDLGTDELYVNEGGSIQGAIDALTAAAAPKRSGAAKTMQSSPTINVAAGTYEEQLEITLDDLTISGAGSASNPASNTIVLSPTTLTYSFTTGSNDNYPVIGIHDATGVVINNVRIDGAGRGNGNYRFQGVGFWNAGGTVSNSVITGIRETPFSGTQHGVAIYAFNDTGGPYAIDVVNNIIDDFQKNAMALSGNGLTVTVDGNDVTGVGPTTVTAQNGIQVSFGATGFIGTNAPNTVDAISYTGGAAGSAGILLYLASGTTEVIDNTITDAKVGIYSIDNSAILEDNAVTLTQAGTGGISDVWGIIADPGNTGASIPPPQPVDAGMAVSGAKTMADFDYTVDNNVVTGDNCVGVGLEIYSSSQTIAFEGTGNTIQDFDKGVVVGEGSANLIESVDFTSNTITGNCTFGLENTAAVVVNATGNDWGDPTGPSGGVSDPSTGLGANGIGDAVSGNVRFDPWVGKETAQTLYLTTDPNDVSAIFGFPNTTWALTPYEATPPTEGEDDWNFNGTSTTTYYLVPEVGTEFGAVDITVEWDESVLTFDGVDETGGLYDTGTSTFFTTQPASNQLRINASRLDNQNITSSAGDYIATLSFSQAASGVSDAEVLPAELSFRRYDGVGGQEGVLVFPDTNTPSVLALLGDVASDSPFSEATGDGLVEFQDLVLFSQAYNSTSASTPTAYKEKFDIGPTADGSVFTLPQLDGLVEFEDLVIFSVSYGLSASGGYTNKKDVAPAPDQPVLVQMQEPQQGAGAEVRIPVSVENATDVRAFSMQFDYDSEAVELVGVEETVLTTSTEQRPVFLEAFTKDGQLWVDGAILGADVEAIHGAGPLFTLVVQQQGSGPLPTLANVRARSSANQELAAKWEEGKGMALDTETPTEYALGANYPNPFNPATTISFDLPESGAVTLQVFDVMGRRVATLVDERRPAGQHTVRWDARQLSSGIYFYTLRAGDFVATRRMVLMK